MIGTTINNFRIIEKIGHGGFADDWNYHGGIVTDYKSYDNKNEKYVILRILNPKLSEKEDVIKRFKYYAKKYVVLKHPNILPAISYGIFNKYAYLEMEYVEHITLSELIESRNYLSIDEASKILSNISGAIDFAHKHEIVHLDLKPKNILIGKDGNDYVIDFCYAYIVRNYFTKAEYKSPELITQPKNVSFSSDIFQLGIILYKMITGGLPFTGETDFTILQKIVNSEFPDPQSLRSDIPETVNPVIYKSLSKNPEDRFKSAGQMAIALKNIVTEISMNETNRKKKVLGKESKILNNNHNSNSNKNSPWLSGSFYLFSIIVLVALFSVIGANLPWHILVIALIGGLLAISIIGAFQLRNDDSLSEKNFLSLMVETFKRLPLLKNVNASKK